MREYRAAHPEKTREVARRYRERYPERVRAGLQAWAAKNAEKKAAYMRQWAAENAEAQREYQRRYYDEHKDHKKRLIKEARQRRRRADLTRSAWETRARKLKDPDAIEFARVLLHDPCAYCGQPAAHIDHIEPQSKGGANHWDNLTAACGHCNPRKHTRSLLTFLLTRKPMEAI
jgi:5-methylcytosine-specific restriction endonuclease McrA